MAESSENIGSGSHLLESLLHGASGEMLQASLEKMRTFAFNLALVEKAASTLGTMNFIWATAVLLGGFALTLKSIDFWFVSIVLVVEGLRILCRQGELATRRSWSPDNMVLQIIFLYSLLIQELSAIACIVLSSLRIHKQQYGSDHNLNRNRALNLFYWLSLVESSLTLLGFSFRIYRSKKDLEEDGFDDSVQEMVLGFFHYTYSRCMNGNVFDGLKMDFVSYSAELLQSINDKEQLTGARFLSMLLTSDLLLSKKTPGVLERLIELLNWEKPQEREIRTVAGEIICKLVQISQNRIRVMAIPESMEAITSLLYDRNQIEIHSSYYQGQSPGGYNYSAFSVLGKRILKFLANDPDNHAKIGTNKGLLRKIIELENLNTNASESEIIRHLKSMPMETLAEQQDVRENNNGTNGFEAEHSMLCISLDSQV